MAESLINLVQVTKHYRRDTIDIPVLDNIDLGIARGEFLALMGPSGSGKTTLLNLIAGIDKPNSGRVVIDGKDIAKFNEQQLAKWRARHVGFIFQLYNLIPVLSAFENVELPLLLTSLSKKKRREHVMTALSVVGLEDREHHYPRQLSGGQEQRVAIARAIVTDPSLLVADEPTGDLDEQTADSLRLLLRDMHRTYGLTSIIATHNTRLAESCDRVLRLEGGRLAAV